MLYLHSNYAYASLIWTQPLLVNLTFWLYLRPASSLWTWWQFRLSPDPNYHHQTRLAHLIQMLWDCVFVGEGTACACPAIRLGSRLVGPCGAAPLATP